MAQARLIYTPEGGSKRTWVFNPEDPEWDISYNTEKVTGWPWSEFAEKMENGSVIALRALIFTLRKRDEPRLDIDAVQPRWGEVDLEEVEEPEPTKGEDADPEA